MITLRKLATLKEGTRLRKITSLLREFVDDLVHERPVDLFYLKGLGVLIGEAVSISLPLREDGAVLAAGKISENPEVLLRFIDDLYYRLSADLGITPGDWDLRDRSTGKIDDAGCRTLPMSVYLEDLRSPFNVGAIFRSAEAFGAEEILLSPGTPSPEHSRTRRTAMGCDEILPWRVEPLEALNERSGVFILELGGVPIEDFEFPHEGTVILGSEELGVSPEAAALAEHGAGRVSIPLLGAKGSLNVSVAFGILVHAWSRAIQ